MMIVAVIKLAIEDNSGDTNNDEQSDAITSSESMSEEPTDDNGESDNKVKGQTNP